MQTWGEAEQGVGGMVMICGVKDNNINNNNKTEETIGTADRKRWIQVRSEWGEYRQPESSSWTVVIKNSGHGWTKVTKKREERQQTATGVNKKSTNNQESLQQSQQTNQRRQPQSQQTVNKVSTKGYRVNNAGIQAQGKRRDEMSSCPVGPQVVSTGGSTQQGR